MDKPTKPTTLMPRSFGGIKNNWSVSMQTTGYEDGVPAIYSGDNLNYQLDATGKELDYCETICDFINNMPIGKTISVDSNNKLIYEENKTIRHIGEIVTSTIPLTDAGLHLLDGSLISGSGIYAEFVTYIASLRSSYSNLFVLETTWQNQVSTYGVCGKFVYDSVNNTVRLPKITGIIGGTTDLTALGDLIEAGLPQHTHSGTTDEGGSHSHKTNRSTSNDDGGSYFTSGNSQTHNDLTTKSVGNHTHTFTTGLSNNPIYGKSSTVQPQTIKVLYYIVVATLTKTEIEVDIDEIATDLNLKAPKEWLYGQFVASSSVLSNASAVGVYNLDLSGYLPNDNRNYIVWFQTVFEAPSNSVAYAYLSTSLLPANIRLGMAYNLGWVSSVIPIPVGTNRAVRYEIVSAYQNVGSLSVHGYCKMGKDN